MLLILKSKLCLIAADLGFIELNSRSGPLLYVSSVGSICVVSSCSVLMSHVLSQCYELYSCICLFLVTSNVM